VVILSRRKRAIAREAGELQIRSGQEIRIKAITPLVRLDEAGEMKSAIVFLAAAASDYITGQMIAVDGGMTAA
jgi:NAD(P)-dependent dehydrogenase (short-subunit alcohol dehydrogenase family)